MTTPLGAHSVSTLGTATATRIGIASPRSAIGGAAQIARERSPFKTASSVQPTVSRDVGSPGGSVPRGQATR